MNGTALGQAITASAFGGLIVAWIALGASMAAALSAAAVLCLAVPVLGWLIGLPLVLAVGLAAAAFWFTVLLMILAAWAFTALTIAVVALARHRRAGD